MAKYQPIVCSNGRIALYDEKDFENAVSLEKSLLIICDGEAYVVGADRIDDSVSMVEFNEKYDIVEVEGKIYTIKEKEN